MSLLEGLASSAFSDGSADLILRDESALAVRVRLVRDTSATIGGVVIHAVTREGIAGVTVSVGGEETLTSARGRFELAAQAAVGQQVRVRAEKEGFEPDVRDRRAGSDTVTIILTPRQ